MFLPLQPENKNKNIDKQFVSNGFDEVSTGAKWRFEGFS